MSQKVGSGGGAGRRTPLSLTAPAKQRKSTPTTSPKAGNSDEESLKRAIIENKQPFVDLSVMSDVDNESLLNALNKAEKEHEIKTSPQKEVKNNDKNEKTEKTNGQNGNGNANGHNEEAKPRESPRPKSAKSTNGEATVVSSPKKNEKKTEPKTPKGDKSTASLDSLAIEKDLKGFNDNGEEMESILIPDDDDIISKPSKIDKSNIVDSPIPSKTPGKVIKMAKGPKPSPLTKSDPLDNVSTMVNLSTVSEQSVETNADSPVVEAPIVSTRRISSRKTYTNRPLREISFRNARETYRKIPEDFDAVNDSVNVTVGSELNQTLDPTPVIGQKRRAPDDVDDDTENLNQSKRGLFRNYCNVM